MLLRKYCLFSFLVSFFIHESIVSASTNLNTTINHDPIVIKKNEATMRKINQNDVKNNELKQDVKHGVNTNLQARQQKIHIVENGENIYRIALKYGIKQSELIKLNGIKNNFIKVGQTLILPDHANSNEMANNDKIQQNNNVDGKKEKITSNNKAMQDVDDNTMAIKAKQDNKQQQSNKTQQPDGKAIQTQAIHQSTFIWPVRGVIVSKFGTMGKNNISLEGNNIATEKDAVVRASSSGIISYNDKVDGYDNVVLIKHYNGFFTAYGHISSTVGVGDKVIKGQVIGYVKPMANSKRSMLYFSIRKQNKSYDPEKIIQSKIDD